MKPNLIFDSKIPEALGKLFGSKWDAVTLYPQGIYFKKKKKDVKEDLFEHEMGHWHQGEKLGPLYFPSILIDYAVNGYKHSKMEAEADDYSLTAEEKKMWKDA